VTSIIRCAHPLRRRRVANHPVLNGIDDLEVLDRAYLDILQTDDVPAGLRQRTLLVRLFKEPPPLRRDNVRIVGGARSAEIGVLWAFRASEFSTDPVDAATPPNTLAIDGRERDFFATLDDASRVLVVRTRAAGDHAAYILRLVASSASEAPPVDVDPLLAEVTFSFHVDCHDDLDCAPPDMCPPETFDEPPIDYLAKDYASFRRLLLDRLSVSMPDWQERNPADLQVALVELLAYTGDRLSYYQDAVATEAYLGTARRRGSLRRHARLLDYPMHDGSNARTWVTLEAGAGHDGVILPGPSGVTPGIMLLTETGRPTGPLPPDEVADALGEGAEVFETLHDLSLFETHNSLRFYTWGDEACHLPAGATKAFLRDDDARRLLLRRGDVLVFEERIGPASGLEVDADPSHRHAVRLTRVEPEAELTLDAQGRPRRSPAPARIDRLTSQAYVEIHWGDPDALPFPLCLSTLVEDTAVEDVSVAHGNVVLADHGRSLDPEPLARHGGGAGRRYRPALREVPVTQQGGVRDTYGHRRLVDETAPAAAALALETRHVRPAVTLLEAGGEDRPWRPQRDLLASDRFAREFVVEVEEDGGARLRFGDDVSGRSPEMGFAPSAYYRIGNGRAGNVGRDAIRNLVLPRSGADPGLLHALAALMSIRNPLPATGGREPERAEEVRRSAPRSYRRQERAVTADDYADVTGRHPEVQTAAATLRWTGSWVTVFVTIDRHGGRPIDAAFEAEIRAFLERYRMAGVDLEIDAPAFVPLELSLDVCAAPGYFRGDVARGLRMALGSLDLPSGARGLFHPDNFTFGQPVHLSRIYEAAHAVAGVSSLKVRTFRRKGRASHGEPEDGVLRMGRLEIAQLANDPSRPEGGRLDLRVEGGQ
jgi:hypothetical protein